MEEQVLQRRQPAAVDERLGKARRLEASVELMDASTVEVRVNGEREQVTVFPPITEYEALRRELAMVGRDPIFEDVLGLAQLLKGHP